MKTPKLTGRFLKGPITKRKNSTFLVLLFFALLCAVIQSCHTNDCGKTFVKKYKNDRGEVYQSDILKMDLKNNDNDSLNVYAFTNENGAFKLVFLSSSYQVHFHPKYNTKRADSLLIVFYGSVAKDSVRRQIYSFEQKGKFKEAETFIIEPALANDILANKSNNVVNFALGNYKFDMSDEMACTIKQMLGSKF